MRVVWATFSLLSCFGIWCGCVWVRTFPETLSGSWCSVFEPAGASFSNSKPSEAEALPAFLNGLRTLPTPAHSPTKGEAHVSARSPANQGTVPSEVSAPLS